MTTVRELPRRERLWLGAGSIAVLIVEAIGVGSPSFWYDEAATYSGASRPLASLWAMADDIDLVHTLFYVLLHPVVALTGPNAFAMRMVSCVAIALGAAGIYLLARTWGTVLSATAAALLFVGLGGTSWMATEARSFALDTMIAIALTLLLLRMLRVPTAKSAIAYGATAVFGIHLFVLLALLVVAHAVTLALIRPTRRQVRVSAAAMASALAVSAPFVFLVSRQRGQLGGTYPIGADSWGHVFVAEFFQLDPLQAWLTWALFAAVAAAVAVRIAIGRRRAGAVAAPSPEVSPRPATAPPSAVAVLLPWLVLPTTVVVVFSAIWPTIFQPRAMVFCAPALCVLLAEGLRRAVGSRTGSRAGSRAALVAAVCIVALGIPTFVATREMTSKGADWPEASSYLRSHACAGDAVVYSDPIDFQSWPSLMQLMYADSLRNLDDIALVTPSAERATLFDERSSIADMGDALSRRDVVWYVYPNALPSDRVANDDDSLGRAGLTKSDTWQGPRTTIERWERVGAQPPARCAKAVS